MAKAKKQVRKLVVVTWGDAWSTSGWQDSSYARERCKSETIYSVGWLCSQNKEGIFLSARIDPEFDNIGNNCFIPRGMIHKIETIKGHQLVSP